MAFNFITFFVLLIFLVLFGTNVYAAVESGAKFSDIFSPFSANGSLVASSLISAIASFMTLIVLIAEMQKKE